MAAIVYGAGGWGGASLPSFYIPPAPPQSSTVSSGGVMTFLGNLTGADSGVTNGKRDDGNPIGYGMGDAKTDHLVPDRLFGRDLAPDGRAHDVKYSTIGYSKEAADAELGKDVSNAMGGGILGAVVGLVYQIGVSLGGQDAYDRAQRDAAPTGSRNGGDGGGGGVATGGNGGDASGGGDRGTRGGF